VARVALAGVVRFVGVLLLGAVAVGCTASEPEAGPETDTCADYCYARYDYCDGGCVGADVGNCRYSCTVQAAQRDGACRSLYFTWLRCKVDHGALYFGGEICQGARDAWGACLWEPSDAGFNPDPQPTGACAGPSERCEAVPCCHGVCEMGCVDSPGVRGWCGMGCIYR